MSDNAIIKGVSAPGRLCLFGEHQDYLGLPVISAAVDIRVAFKARPADHRLLKISMPDIGESTEIDPSGESEYSGTRDYLRSGVNILLKKGFKFDNGYDVRLSGDIPIGKGCASSSALITAWIALLCRISTSGPNTDTAAVAEMAFNAEVTEFKEPGGMMDHFSAAFGNILFIKTMPPPGVARLDENIPGTFILGDSGDPKNTTGMLGDIRSLADEAMEIVGKKVSKANWHTIQGAAAKQSLRDHPIELQHVMAANVANRDITREAVRQFESGAPDPDILGALMTEQHEYLSSYLGVSTEKIDKMVFAAIEAGAHGAKINGSGGGGCMFAYCPLDKLGEISAAIENAGGTTREVKICDGLREEDE